MKRELIVLMVLASLGGGCIQSDDRHAIHVEADGSVTWIVQRTGIHSDKEGRDERNQEEAEFLSAVREGRLDTELTLLSMGGSDVRTDLLREQRPFDVRVEAGFPSLAEAFGGLLACVEGGSWLETGDGLTTWRFEVGAAIEDCEEEDSTTFLDGDEYRVILSEGEFVEAIGFEFSSREAVMMDLEDLNPDGTYPEESIVLSLTWTTP